MGRGQATKQATEMRWSMAENLDSVLDGLVSVEEAFLDTDAERHIDGVRILHKEMARLREIIQIETGKVQDASR